MKRPFLSGVLVLAILPGLLPPARAYAQWSTDPAVNTAVCTLPSRPSNVWVVGDGMDGAIIGWVDFDLATGEYDIRAQRISAAGTIQWGPAGVPICTIPAVLQTQLRMASDGAGGAILAWMDMRDGINNLFAQRIDASGAAHWTPGGVQVCPSIYQQVICAVVADGAGGVFVSWQDARNPGINSPYAQRLNHDGVPQWAPEGVLLASGTSESIEIASDGTGGAFFAWHKYVSGQFDIQAQRLASDGNLAWGPAGITVCSQTRDQLRPQPIVDGTGGVIMVWEDYRTIGYSNAYAQRLDGSGVAQWAANGVAAAPNALDQRDPKLLSDGAGGAFIVWSYATGYGIYAQRIVAGGTRQWATDGARIAARGGHSWKPVIIGDGAGGAIIGWCDDRASSLTFDVFAQRINPAGAVQWTTDGISVCSNTASQFPVYLVADGHGGAIACWHDGRNDATTDTDLYAQHITAAGELGPLVGVGDSPLAAGAVTLAQNVPNPCRSATTIEWRMPERGPVSLEVFDLLGRRVATLASGELGPGVHSRELDTAELAGGVYQYRLRAGTESHSRRMVVTK